MTREEREFLNDIRNFTTLFNLILRRKSSVREPGQRFPLYDPVGNVNAGNFYRCHVSWEPY